MVRMCLLPDVEVSQSVTKSIAILSNGLLGISVICQWILLDFSFFSSAKDAVGNVFPNVLIHAFPIVWTFDETICVGVSLMNQVYHGLPLILCISKIWG